MSDHSPPESMDRRTAELLVKGVSESAVLEHWWPLPGGVSRQVVALEVREADQMARWVAHLSGQRQPSKDASLTAADELQLLRLLRDSGLPVAEPLWAGPVGDGGSALVTRFVPGKLGTNVGETEMIEASATALSRIHALDVVAEMSDLVPMVTERGRRLLMKHRQRPGEGGVVVTTLEAVWPLVERNAAVLVHGDFWPGNVVWDDDGIAAVIDWEDAAVGDPLADLSGARLETLWRFGAPAMGELTRRYRQLSPHVRWDDLPYWDLWAGLQSTALSQWELEPEEAARMRELRDGFVTAALERLDPPVQPGRPDRSEV